MRFFRELTSSYELLVNPLSTSYHRPRRTKYVQNTFLLLSKTLTSFYVMSELHHDHAARAHTAPGPAVVIFSDHDRSRRGP